MKGVIVISINDDGTPRIESVPQNMLALEVVSALNKVVQFYIDQILVISKSMQGHNGKENVNEQRNKEPEAVGSDSQRIVADSN